MRVTPRVDRTSSFTFAAAGLGVVAMTIPATALYPNPKPNAPAAELASALTQNLGTLTVSIDLQLLALIPFVVFASGIWRLLDRAGQSQLSFAFLLGAAVNAATIVTWQAAIGAAGLVGHYDPGTDLRPMAASINALDKVVTLPLAILVGAPSLAMIRGTIATRWLGWLGLVTAGFALVGILDITTVMAPTGIANPISLMLFMLWIVGLSIVEGWVPLISALREADDLAGDAVG